MKFKHHQILSWNTIHWVGKSQSKFLDAHEFPKLNQDGIKKNLNSSATSCQIGKSKQKQQKKTTENDKENNKQTKYIRKTRCSPWRQWLAKLSSVVPIFSKFELTIISNINEEQSYQIAVFLQIVQFSFYVFPLFFWKWQSSLYWLGTCDLGETCMVLLEGTPSFLSVPSTVSRTCPGYLLDM